MKLVVGLGNPGRQYAGTRHNVGFDVADLLAARHGLEWEAAPRGIEALVAMGALTVTTGVSTVASAFRRKIAMAKPLTSMNLSGPAIVGLLQFFKIENGDLLVVVDETNLELGRLRARAAGSAGGHNGLKSVIEALGTKEFARLRIGVGRGDARRDLSDHVLARFDAQERQAVEDAVGRSAEAVELFVAEGIQPVMNRFNRKDDGKEEDAKEDGE